MNSMTGVATPNVVVDKVLAPQADLQAPVESSAKPSNYYDHLRREVLELIPVGASRLLDVGCGAGILGSALKAAAKIEVHGIELVPDVAAIAATRLDRIWTSSVEDALPQLPDSHYDCIVVADVLEHLIDPLSVLRALRNKLRPHGIIVASIPNVQNWGVLSALIEGRFDYTADGILDRTHLRFFTRRSVEQLFWSAGLKIEILATTTRGPSLPEAFSAECERAGLDAESIRRDAMTFQFLVRAQLPEIFEPRIAVIVLNWNGRDDTMRCLSSLQRVDYHRSEIVVVDNGSSDGSVASIRTAFPEISIIENGRNLGYAGGNNAGIQWALKRGFDYILILNNDTIVAEDFLKVLASSASRLPAESIIGAAMLLDNKPDTIWMLGGIWSHRSCSFNDDGANKALSEFANSVREVDYVVGCSIFASRFVFENVGLFDEKFFLHYEEIDFCSRAKQIGSRCFVDTKAKLWHKAGASTGGDESPLVEYFRIRNQLRWAKRHLPANEAHRVSARAWRRLRSILLPTTRSVKFTALTPKSSYWEILSWLKSIRRSLSNRRNRAYIAGMRDHYLNRYGDCPASIRRLSNQRPAS